MVTDRFPEVAAALEEALGSRSAVLDGELVAPGEGGLPDFERLQARARTTATPARVAAHPVSFVAFDLLALDGLDLTGRPLWERRALLDGLGLDAHPRLLVSPVFTDVDPMVLLATARSYGVEGVVSKAPQSRYSSGRRSKAWIKTVVTQRSVFAVGGVAQGRSRRAGAVGSLLLGRPTGEGGLEFVGEVGTGWTSASYAELTARLGGAGHRGLPVHPRRRAAPGRGPVRAPRAARHGRLPGASPGPAAAPPQLEGPGPRRPARRRRLNSSRASLRWGTVGGVRRLWRTWRWLRHDGRELSLLDVARGWS